MAGFERSNNLSVTENQEKGQGRFKRRWLEIADYLWSADNSQQEVFSVCLGGGRRNHLRDDVTTIRDIGHHITKLYVL
jgi:hypothetical protein